MARLGVIAIVFVIVVSGAAVIYHEFTLGSWIKGLIFGLIPAAMTLHGWYVARAMGPETERLAARFAAAVMLALAGLAGPGFDLIETKIRADADKDDVGTESAVQ
jgi:hypothetical protein